MKQLTCEMCGGTELIKQNGVFVCQTCGTKYSVEEAKKMMIEGTVEIQGTVKVDNSSNIENYLNLAENALSAKNDKEAENYSNKILEIQPNHYKAWLIKGKAAGWQSSLANNRFLESIECFGKAVEYVPDPEASVLKKEVAEEMSSLSKTLISLCCNSFTDVPNDNNAEKLLKCVASVKTSAIMLLKKCGCIPTEYGETMALSIRDAALTAYSNKVWPEYSQSNGGHPYDFQFVKFVDNAFACIKVLKCSIAMLEENSQLRIKSYKALITITHAIINAAGYEKQYYSNGSPYWAVTKTLTASAKQSNIENIQLYHQKIKELDPNYEIPTIDNSKENRCIKIGALIGGIVGTIAGILLCNYGLQINRAAVAAGVSADSSGVILVFGFGAPLVAGILIGGLAGYIVSSKKQK